MHGSPSPLNPLARFGWWCRSVWGATLAGFGVRTGSSFGADYTFKARRGSRPPLDLSQVRPPPWLPVEDEIGVAAGQRSVLLSNDRLAVALVDCVAYSSGFEFTITVRFGSDIEPQAIYGMPPDPDRELHVRIAYPDGTEGTNEGAGPGGQTSRYYEAIYEGRDPGMPAGPVVSARGGSGGSRRYEMSFYCWPLPPDGPMTVTVDWQAAGIPATTVEVDASAIHRAGLTSTKLWSQ